MADADSKRFYLALLIWVGAFLLGLALRYAGVHNATVEAMAFSFILGLAAIFAFFRPSRV